MTHNTHEKQDEASFVHVYLDMNVLTELRRTKWGGKFNKYALMEFLFLQSNAVICGSHVTINEILQIGIDKNIAEHVAVLKKLGFFYFSWE